MNIFDRLSRLVRSNVNDLISKAEDPSKIIDQSLLDMRSALAEARSEVAEALAGAAKLEREAESNRTIAEGYEGKAEEALRGGSESLAREALRRAQNHKDLAKSFDDQLTIQRTTVDQLKTQLRALEVRIDEMESKKTLLAARQETAEANAALGRASGFDRAGSALDAFEDMEDKVASMEDKNRALQELNSEKDLDAQLRDLGRNSELDDAMAALKAKVAADEK